MSGLRVFVCPECGEQRRLSTLTAACEGCGGDRAPVEVEVVPRGVADRLAEAVEAAEGRLMRYLRGESGLDFVRPYPAARTAAEILAAALAAYREETGSDG